MVYNSMIQNSNCPFTNTFLVKSIAEHQINPNGCSVSSLWNKCMLKSLDETISMYPDRAINITTTSLNYSGGPLVVQEIDGQNRSQFRQESVEIGANEDNTQLLKELLACEEVMEKSEMTISRQHKVEDQGGQLQQDQLSNGQNRQGNTSFDYSEDLNKLKLRISEIQEMAQQEIGRLKLQLAHQRQTARTKVDWPKDKVEVGVNTDSDLRQLEIEMLRQSLIRHMALNKQLLQKQLDNKGKGKYQSLQNHINCISL